MQKIIVCLVFISALVACKKEIRNTPREKTAPIGIVKTDWKKKTGLKPKAIAILKDWPEFNALETSFDGLYTVENAEDLTLVMDDLIEKLKLLRKSSYPSAFDKPQVKSRQKVLKTFMLKTKGHLEYNLDVNEVTSELTYAHNAFLNQFNVLINNEIPQEILDNE